MLAPELLVYHRRFDDRREQYRPSIREWVELGEERSVSAERYARRAAAPPRDDGGLRGVARARADHGAASSRPSPVVAPLRGDGYDHAGSDAALISLTHYWDWTGFPVAALPAGVGARSGLPVSVSLIGPAGTDWEVLDIGIQLQAELGVDDPYAAR